MQRRCLISLLAVLIAAVLAPDAARAAEDEGALLEPAIGVIDEDAATRCDEAFGLWDDLAADPDPAINPNRQARRHLRRGVALCRAGDDDGADYLFKALTLVGAQGS